MDSKYTEQREYYLGWYMTMSDLFQKIISTMNRSKIRFFFDSVTFKEYIIFYNNSRYCGSKLKAYNIKWLS